MEMRKLLPLVLALTFVKCVFGQADLPIVGDISEIKGKTKFYLVAGAQDRKQILGEIDRKKIGLEIVKVPEDADFVIEYRETNNKEKTVMGDLSITSKSGQMDVYFYRNGRKVVVWSEGKTASFSTAAVLALPRKFLKDLVAK